MKKLLAMKWLVGFICFSAACSVQCPAQLLNPEPQEKSPAEQAVEAVIRKPSLKTREFINPRIALTAERYLKALDSERHHIWNAQLDPEEEKLLVQELRRRYPAISIEKRLERINNPQRIEEVSKLYSGDLSNNAQTDVRNQYFSERRKTALSELHSAKVSEFVDADNFGMSRMPQISPRDLRYRDRGPIALKTQSGISALYSSEKLVELPPHPGKSDSSDSSSAQSKPELPTATLNDHKMPFMETVAGLNKSAQRQFLSVDRIGVTNKVGQELDLETNIGPKEVIGFEGHGIDHLYDRDLGIYLSGQSQPRQPSEKHWNLNRLELVSLLMNDEFMVYVSENLPRMEDLQEVPTRKVDSFELMGLSKLFKGEDVVVESTTNRIRMLGALRASESCLECHSVKEGELLGALSYELIRQVPIEEK